MLKDFYAKAEEDKEHQLRPATADTGLRGSAMVGVISRPTGSDSIPQPATVGQPAQSVNRRELH